MPTTMTQPTSTQFISNARRVVEDLREMAEGESDLPKMSRLESAAALLETLVDALDADTTERDKAQGQSPA